MRQTPNAIYETEFDINVNKTVKQTNWATIGEI